MISQHPTNTLRGYFLPLLFAAMLLLYGCTDEQTTPPDSGKTITFSLNLPKGFDPVTYALSEPDENEVRTVDVLLFDGTSGNYISGPHRGDIAGDKVTLRSIPQSATGYTMAVFANSRDVIDGITIAGGETKSTYLAKATLTHTGKWETDNRSSNYKPIPMYGEISAVDVAAKTPVSLVRMLARVNVRVTTAAGMFSLESVSLGNYNTNGYIAALSKGSVNIPTDAGFTAATESYPVVSNSCLNEIYTFEAAAGDAANISTNPCIIIGGTYNGESDNYYRIDIANVTAGVPTYLPILRNHSYNINIEKINGPGYSTAAEAFAARPVNVVYSVAAWDESMTNVVYDGQYALSVSQSEFTFDKATRSTSSSDNTLLISTTNPSGWSVSIAQSGSWLSLKNTSGGDFPSPVSGAGTTTAKLVITDAATSDRTATITFTSGNLTQTVTVNQKNVAPSITTTNASSVAIDELYFESALDVAPQYKTFTLSWTPSDVTPTFTSTFTAGKIDNVTFPSSGTVSKSSGSSFTVAPSAITTADYDSGSGITERTSVITYQLSYGGTTVNKILKIRHKAIVPPPAPAIPLITITLPSNMRNGTCYLNGSSYNLTVNSNVDWKITSVTETFISGTTGTLLTNLSSLQNKTGSAGSESITLTATGSSSSPTQRDGSVTITFAPQSGDSYPGGNSVTLSFAGVRAGKSSSNEVIWAGSNIYWTDVDGGKLTFDSSVTKATNDDIPSNNRKQGVFFKWGSLYGVSAGPEGSNTNVTIYKPDGDTYTTNLGSSNDANWAAIPYVSDISASSANTNFLYYRTDDVSNPGSAQRGDICRWITLMGWAPSGSGNWRMPTASEFGSASLTNYPVPTGLSSGGQGSGANVVKYGNGNTAGSGITFAGETPTNVTGTGILGGDRGRFATSSINPAQPFYPAAGYRDASGTLSYVGTNGRYWSGSPYSTNGRILYFYSSNAGLDYSFRTNGYSVRCVRDI